MANGLREPDPDLKEDELRIVRRSLHDEVVERLRDMIVGGLLEEGERLREKKLCERFGISRTPLREALKVLTSEGLLELLPNRGARVTRLSLSDLEDMFEVMSALECLAGELSCKHITDEEVEAIRQLHDTMLRYYRRNDFLNMFKIDQEIHKSIVAASRNETLQGVYESLAGRMRRARFKGARRDAGQQALMDDHIEMVEALSERNGALLGQIMRRHIQRKGAIARDVISSEFSSEMAP